MTDEQPSISITLSPTQVDSIVRAAQNGSAPGIAAMISRRVGAPDGGPPIDTEDPRLSRSLMRGLSLLSGFNADGDPRGIVELANDLGLSPSTAHRYALTLLELGLLERCPNTRKYRPTRT
jgi:hypothetical protein